MLNCFKNVFQESENSAVGRRGEALVVSDRFSTKLRSPQTKVGKLDPTEERELISLELKGKSPPDLR